MSNHRTHLASVYRHLVVGFESSRGGPPEASWQWLAAAHVVGQAEFALHWSSHRLMLDFALRQGDWPEAAGQVMRLALVPLGHALGRLPVGNTGRSTVSAFRAMEVAGPVGELIARARDAAIGH